MQHSKNWQPFLISLCIAFGIAIGILLRPSHGSLISGDSKGRKLREVFGLLEQVYVDTIRVADLEETAIEDMLAKLDPHSVYLSVDDLKLANEQLEGSFEGIGVEFSIVNDTIMVVSPIDGGPSALLGIQSGDRIVKVDTISVAGVGITNERVMKLLRGERGTSVTVSVVRNGLLTPKQYTITRNTIPVHSVDAAFMLSEHTGYIRISRFAMDTYDSFEAQLKKLVGTPGFSQLIIDLRGNPGGYLDAVTRMVDEVLADGKLIVYTEGRMQPRNNYLSQHKGLFESGKLALLIDEGSASASEIFAGAVQDHDRGIIIGRRSFGKGLVQEPFNLSDGSGLRITIARYYTPSGRCIQKPYDKGNEAYEQEVFDRFEHGETQDVSNIHLTDSTPYYTQKKRIVYGGGGVTPDVFVPADTAYKNKYVYEIISKNYIRQFVAEYSQKHRKQWLKYETPQVFLRKFHTNVLPSFLAYLSNLEMRDPTQAEWKQAQKYIEKQLLAHIAKQIWGNEGLWYVLCQEDAFVKAAEQQFANPPAWLR